MPNIFGLPTADEIQQERFSNAVQLFSQAAPGVAPAVLAGQGVARGVGGLFGAKDIQLERANRLREVQAELTAEGIGPGTPEFLKTASQRLRARGLFDAAAMVEQQGGKLEKEVLEREKLRLGNIKAQQDILEAQRTMAEEGSLTGDAAVANRIAKLPLSNTDLEKFVGDAQAELRAANVPESARTLRAVLELAQFLQRAERTAQRTTTTRAGFGGDSTSTTATSYNPRAITRQYIAERGVPRQAEEGSAPVTVQPVARGQADAPAAEARARVIQSQGVPTVKARKAGKVSELNIDNAADIAARNGGRIPLKSDLTPNQLMRRFQYGEPMINKMQDQARVQIGAINKLMDAQNDMARVIEEHGAAFPSVIGRWARGFNDAVSGSDTWTADAARLVSSNLSALVSEFEDPEQRLVVRKLNRAVMRMALDQKELDNLGALTGPDMSVLRAIIANPTEFLFRRTGIEGFFDLAGSSMREYLRGAQSAIGSSGIQGGFSIPAPHPFYRLSEHKGEVSDIIDRMQANELNPQQAAGQMSRRLGFRVTPNGAQMLSSTGKYKPRGGTAEAVSRTIQNPLGPRSSEADKINEITGLGKTAILPDIGLGKGERSMRSRLLEFMRIFD